MSNDNTNAPRETAAAMAHTVQTCGLVIGSATLALRPRRRDVFAASVFRSSHRAIAGPTCRSRGVESAGASVSFTFAFVLGSGSGTEAGADAGGSAGATVDFGTSTASIGAVSSPLPDHS